MFDHTNPQIIKTLQMGLIGNLTFSGSFVTNEFNQEFDIPHFLRAPNVYIVFFSGHDILMHIIQFLPDNETYSIFTEDITSEEAVKRIQWLLNHNIVLRINE